MSKLTLAGIRRGNQFSPNHIGNDAAIFALTAQHLRKLGCDVNEYIESDLLLQDPKEKGIFNMVRDWKSIHKLQELEDKNYFVVNSGYGIENCTREKMTRLLLSNHISHPASLILRTDEDPTEALEKAGFFNCWIKRGDFHAIHREDVTYVRNPEEAKSILKEYAIFHVYDLPLHGNCWKCTGSDGCDDRDRRDGTHRDSGYLKYRGCYEYDPEHGCYAAVYQLRRYVRHVPDAGDGDGVKRLEPD